MGDTAVNCGNCGAALGSTSAICAACGKGTKAGKPGVCIGNAVDRDGRVRGKFFVTAGSSGQQMRYADDGYAIRRADEERELDAEAAADRAELRQLDLEDG
jgi:hypothetical protein